MSAFWIDIRKKFASSVGLDLTHAQKHYGDILRKYIPKGAVWLDMGCGRQILPEWGASLHEQKDLVNQSSRLIGLDVDSALHEHPFLHDRVIGLGNNLPFKAESLDLVSANMVMEHVDDPPQVFKEVNRVLRPGGRFIFHTPNFKNYLILIASLISSGIKNKIVWLLEQRREEDVFKTFYRSNTTEAVQELATKNGLKVVSLATYGSSGSFERLGPLGVLEVLLLKLVSPPFFSQCNATIIAVLEKA